MLTAVQVKERATALGFDLCGIAPAASFPELRFLREWIAKGYAGEMGYMSKTKDRRGDVRNILPSARTVVVLATVYNVERPYSTESTNLQEAQISRYAWGDDYHEIIGNRTNELLKWMREKHNESFDAKTYVDTGPIQEKVYAQHAGLGWIGKNTCLINSDLGSWIFLSEIVCSLSLDPDPPGLDQCGTCRLCLDACPTDAIVAPWVLDATRCISYLTIELKEGIPPAARAGIGSHVYGCDVCQEVCPWNAAPSQSSMSEWLPRRDFDRVKLLDLWQRSDRDLRQSLKHSPMRRANVSGLRRNIAVAIGNCKDPDAVKAFDETPRSDDCDHSSKQDSLVVDHVTWAKRKLSAKPTD